jgi:hypothetical protein
MQTELLNRRRWTTRVELANAIFEYIEAFHNRRRRHSALGWQTPVEFENTIRNRAPAPQIQVQKYWVMISPSGKPGKLMPVDHGRSVLRSGVCLQVGVRCCGVRVHVASALPTQVRQVAIC